MNEPKTIKLLSTEEQTLREEIRKKMRQLKQKSRELIEAKKQKDRLGSGQEETRGTETAPVLDSSGARLIVSDTVEITN